MSDFVIENGRLVKYTGNKAHVVIPENITCIGDKAFCDCINLNSVTIPDSVTSIGYRSFSDCYNLSGVVIPSSVTYIGSKAFGNCFKLKTVQLPSLLVDVESDAFDARCSFGIEDYSALNGKAEISSIFAQKKLEVSFTDQERASILVHQKSKSWLRWVIETTVNQEEVLRAAITLLEIEKKPASNVVKNIVAYMQEHAKNIPAKAIADMLDALEKKGAKPDRALFSDIVGAATCSNAPTETAKDAFAAKCLKGYQMAAEVVAAIKVGTKIHRKGTQALVPLDEIRYVLSRFVQMWHRCKFSRSGGMGTVEVMDFRKVVALQITPDIVHFAETFDRKELDTLLSKLVHGAKYRPFVLAYGALASDDEVKLIADEIIRKSKGPAKDRYWAEHMEYALYLSSEHEAMLFFDRIGKLNSYAQWRFNTNEQYLRDTYMMPQFDFDADGIKRYDIGGNIIEVSIAPDLSCQLYDTKNKKIVRSMPKKSDDPEKAAACATDYAAFKKSIKDFYAQRMKNMLKLHIEGTWIEADSWRRVYIDHPVVKLAARLLVWQDEKGRTFTPTANGIIGINGEVYEPVGKIQLAHVLSLSPEEVSAWQDYYANNHLQQPFAQVWEPVIPWNQEQAVTRYKNKLLTRANRNALKKALEFAGISMRSEIEDLGYNYREGKHEFANHGQLHFDQFFSLDFELYDGDLLLGDGRVSLRRKKPSANVLRGMNAVLAQLDFAIARDAAAETSEAELVKLDLTHFTLAQINELINIATANKSTACTAYLLNLKNERFPQYNALDHLVLDW